jgi:hypothetical protein
MIRLCFFCQYRYDGLWRTDVFYGLLFVVVGSFGTLYSVVLLLRRERREKWLAYILSSAMLLLWGAVSLSPLRPELIKWLHSILIGS